MPLRISGGWANDIGHANEDRWIVHEGEDDWNIYSVMDGHGGKQAVTFVHAALTETLIHSLREQDEKLLAANDVDAFHAGFTLSVRGRYERVEEKVLEYAHDCSGVCVTAVVLSRRHPVGFAVHLGDCRVVLAREDGVPLAVTEDHQMANPVERARILATGYQPMGNRVAGLEPTRTIGDFDVKDCVPGAVSWEPDVIPIHFPLQGRDGPARGGFGGSRRAGAGAGTSTIILATDGVWGTLGDFTATVAVQRALYERGSPNPTAAAQALTTLARSKGSMDDIATVVIHVEH